MNKGSSGKSTRKRKEWFYAAGRVLAWVLVGLLGASTASAQSVQPIYSFPQSPSFPYGGLVKGLDGNFYGTTFEGGHGGTGAIFKVATNGVLSMIYSFSTPLGTMNNAVTNTDGAQPKGSLALGPDGNLYGTTTTGGALALGTVFKVTANGVLTTLHSFENYLDGATPDAGLTLGKDGNFYGTTYEGGTNFDGTVFEVTTNGTFTVVHYFTALYDGPNGSVTNHEGAWPESGLTLGTNGTLYGTTTAGGVGGSGTLFGLSTNLVLNLIHPLSASADDENYVSTNAEGESPEAALTIGLDGNLYGTTVSGGTNGNGTVFRSSTEGALTVLHAFSEDDVNLNADALTNLDGASPEAALTLGPNGSLYGVARGGGIMGGGTFFNVTGNGTFTTLLAFTNGNGTMPAGALTLGTNGIFYGTTSGGGRARAGTVFAVTTNGALTTLFTFANVNGELPYAGLTLAPNGKFYGTTSRGGSNSYGTIFQVTTNGAFTTLASFAGTNGWSPEANLTLGTNGNFYGTTVYGGNTNNNGTLFEVTTNGVLTMLVEFSGTNGLHPQAGLTLGAKGTLYGTTEFGGSNNYGTVFALTTNGVLTTLYYFTNGADGSEPLGSLTLGANGNYYGTCASGGTYDSGTAFEITPGGTFTALRPFPGGNEASPYAALTLEPNGSFYGTTTGNGYSTYGNVFAMTFYGLTTGIHNFTGGSDSGYPAAALTLGPDGNYYGTTCGNLAGAPGEGASNPTGTVFEVKSNGTFITLVTFAITNGEWSRGSLTLGPDGNFYGTTSSGGSDGIGGIYRLNLPPEVTQPPCSRSVNAGSGTTLSASLFGTGPYSYQWLSNGIPILAATNASLNIFNFSAGDAADYSVLVSNAWGSVTSAVALVTYSGPPVISSVTWSASGGVVLNCQGQTNAATRLWATTNLAVPAAWTPMFTNSVTSASGAWQFTDTNIPSQQRYYRLSTP